MLHQPLFETMYTTHYAMVLQVCTGFLKGDSVQAKDLTQEVFMQAWNALPRYRGDSSHKTWLYRITVNTCLQYFRKQKKTTESLSEKFSVNIQETTPKTYPELYQAIGRLDEIDRLIIMMVLDGIDYPEISQITGVSENTLRVRIHRIKGKLKKILTNGLQH